MPQESQLAHRTLRNLNIPYVTNVSPIDTTAHYVSGSSDILTSISGYAERRPGFSGTVETTPTVFNNLQRIFTWDRTDGTFYIMACDVNASGFAQVYKLASSDASFVSIYTDTSSVPFDFVVSNNTLYFANGVTAKKWDPTNGLSNWGIAIGSVSNAVGPNGVGTGADVAASGSTSVWANPGNITAQDAVYSTTTLAPGGGANSAGPNLPTIAAGSWTNINNIKAADGSYATRSLSPLATSPLIQATGFGFNIPSNATITAITASVTHSDIGGVGSLVDATVQLLKAGTAVGSNKATNSAWGIAETVSYGGDLWGTTWLYSDINNTGFGIELSVTNQDNFNSDTAGVDVIKLKVSYTLPVGSVSSDYLQGTNCGFAIPATETVLGILVEVKGFQTQTASSYLSATMLKGGTRIGTTKTGSMLPASNGFISFGANNDLWGTTWTYNDVNQTTFGVSLQAVNGAGSSVSWSVDFVRITIFGLGGPTVALVAGGFTPAPSTGFFYVFTYGNSNTGHISSPSPASALIKPDGTHSVQVTLTASTDPQVNQIHVYRTTDGGAGSYFEIPTSPYANSSANITDNAADTALNISSIAPTATFNDPPTPFQGPVYFSGRIWGFAGNKVYFSGLEEIIQGVPEESFPSGLAGNFWAFDEPVQGLAVAGTGDNQTLAVFCGGRIYGITGNTLDTFRRFSISQRRGCRNRTCIATLGGMVAWYDSANQIWASDGNTLKELSTDIRSDFVGLSPTNCSMTFHVSGRYHWLLFSTGANVYVYDMDMEQWMPPWSPDLSYIFSGETSPGNYVLMASNGKKAIQLGNNFNDNGTTYAPVMKTCLLSVVPDFGARFSYMAAGIYDEPTRTGVPFTFQVTNNNNAIADFSIIADDDPTKGVYSSILSSLQNPNVAYNRGQGTFVTQNIFLTTSPSARWIGMQLKLANADTDDKIYEMFFAYKGLGGR